MWDSPEADPPFRSPRNPSVHGITSVGRLPGLARARRGITARTRTSAQYRRVCRGPARRHAASRTYPRPAVRRVTASGSKSSSGRRFGPNDVVHLREWMAPRHMSVESSRPVINPDGPARPSGAPSPRKAAESAAAMGQVSCGNPSENVRSVVFPSV